MPHFSWKRASHDGRAGRGGAGGEGTLRGKADVVGLGLSGLETELESPIMKGVESAVGVGGSVEVLCDDEAIGGYT